MTETTNWGGIITIVSLKLAPKVTKMLIAECTYEDKMPSTQFYDEITADNAKIIADTFRNGFREAA